VSNAFSDIFSHRIPHNASVRLARIFVQCNLDEDALGPFFRGWQRTCPVTTLSWCHPMHPRSCHATLPIILSRIDLLRWRNVPASSAGRRSLEDRHGGGGRADSTSPQSISSLSILASFASLLSATCVFDSWLTRYSTNLYQQTPSNMQIFVKT